MVHVLWHRVPKEVHSIPNLKSSDVCYNLLPLSSRQHPPGSRSKLPLPSSDNSPYTFTSISHSFFRFFCSFFLPFSFLFHLSFFTLRPLLIFFVFLSATHPEGGGCVFLPNIHHTYENTRSDNPYKYSSYIATFTGECHYVWQHKLCNGFFTEQKIGAQTSILSPRTTHDTYI